MKWIAKQYFWVACTLIGSCYYLSLHCAKASQQTISSSHEEQTPAKALQSFQSKVFYGKIPRESLSKSIVELKKQHPFKAAPDTWSHLARVIYSNDTNLGENLFDGLMNDTELSDQQRITAVKTSYECKKSLFDHRLGLLKDFIHGPNRTMMTRINALDVIREQSRQTGGRHLFFKELKALSQARPTFCVDAITENLKLYDTLQNFAATVASLDEPLASAITKQLWTYALSSSAKFDQSDFHSLLLLTLQLKHFDIKQHGQSALKVLESYRKDGLPKLEGNLDLNCRLLKVILNEHLKGNSYEIDQILPILVCDMLNSNDQTQRYWGCWACATSFTAEYKGIYITPPLYLKKDPFDQTQTQTLQNIWQDVLASNKENNIHHRTNTWAWLKALGIDGQKLKQELFVEARQSLDSKWPDVSKALRYLWPFLTETEKASILEGINQIETFEKKEYYLKIASVEEEKDKIFSYIQALEEMEIDFNDALSLSSIFKTSSSLHRRKLFCQKLIKLIEHGIKDFHFLAPLDNLRRDNYSNENKYQIFSVVSNTYSWLPRPKSLPIPHIFFLRLAEAPDFQSVLNSIYIIFEKAASNMAEKQISPNSNESLKIIYDIFKAFETEIPTLDSKERLLFLEQVSFFIARGNLQVALEMLEKLAKANNHSATQLYTLVLANLSAHYHKEELQGVLAAGFRLITQGKLDPEVRIALAEALLESKTYAAKVYVAFKQFLLKQSPEQQQKFQTILQNILEWPVGRSIMSQILALRSLEVLGHPQQAFKQTLTNETIKLMSDFFVTGDHATAALMQLWPSLNEEEKADLLNRVQKLELEDKDELLLMACKRTELYIALIASETNPQKLLRYVDQLYQNLTNGKDLPNLPLDTKHTLRLINVLKNLLPFQEHLNSPQGIKFCQHMIQFLHIYMDGKWSDISKDDRIRVESFCDFAHKIAPKTCFKFGLPQIYFERLQQLEDQQDLVKYIDKIYHFMEWSNYLPSSKQRAIILKTHERLKLNPKLENDLLCLAQIACLSIPVSDENANLDCSINFLQQVSKNTMNLPTPYALALRCLFVDYEGNEKLKPLFPIALNLIKTQSLDAKVRLALAISLLETHEEKALDVFRAICLDKTVSIKNRINAAELLVESGTEADKLQVQKFATPLYQNKKLELKQRLKAAGCVFAGPEISLKKQAKGFLLSHMYQQQQKEQSVLQLKQVHTWAAKALIETISQDSEDGQKAFKILMDGDLKEHSSYKMHKALLEKLKSKVTHNPLIQQNITINTDKMQITIDPNIVPKVSHADLLALFEEAVKESESNKAKKTEFNTIRHCMADKDSKKGVTVAQMRAGLNRPELQNLFAPEAVTQSNINPHAAMLRFFVDMTQKKAGAKSTTDQLSDRAKQIIGFAINCCTCGTGRTDTTNALFAGAGIVEQLERAGIQIQRLPKQYPELHEILQNVLFELKMKALSGTGVLVQKLLDQTAEEIDEPPHQRQYLMNLSGPHIGIRPQNSLPRYDDNIGCVDEELLKLSAQDALDAFYKYAFTPKIVLAWVHKEFNARLKQRGQKEKISLFNTIIGALKESNLLECVTLDDGDNCDALTEKGVKQLLINLGYFKSS